ncbi:nucleotidyltransferase family protein [Listeria monocytogenes]|nr:nucleotidyltransferase family protein [Listeria monocytogenes]
MVEKLLNQYPLEDKLMFLLTRNDILENQKVLNLIRKTSLDSNLSFELFLGKVMFNRVNGVVYNNLKRLNLKINREVFMMLEQTYFNQLNRNNLFLKYVDTISDKLKKNKVKFIFLKGTVLNYTLYDDGERISNDIDVLIDYSDSKKVTDTLLEMGFSQGRAIHRDNTIEYATKKEIMFSQINTHELFPFIKYDKETDSLIKVDVQFRVDSIFSKSLTSMFLENAMEWEIRESIRIPSLPIEYFYVHLCAHLYREAISIGKIMENSDFMMYKLLDIYKMRIQLTHLNYEVIDSLIKENDELEKSIIYVEFLLHLVFPDFEIWNIDFQDKDLFDRVLLDTRANKWINWEVPMQERISNINRRAIFDF